MESRLRKKLTHRIIRYCNLYENEKEALMKMEIHKLISTYKLFLVDSLIKREYEITRKKLIKII